MRRSSVPSRVAPRFIWQGALIVLPALLLAAMGLIALRQDRILARVEAEEQAARLLSDLANFAFPQVVALRLEELASLRIDNQTWRLPSTPDREPLARLTSGLNGDGPFQTACLVDDSDRLIYPPPPRGLPAPEPLNVDDLTLAQQEAWVACEEMWSTGLPDLSRVQALAAAGASERLIVLARLRTALALAREGLAGDLSQPGVSKDPANPGPAELGLTLASRAPASGAPKTSFLRGVAELRQLRDAPAEIVSESGIPARNLAALQLALLAQALPAAERADAVNGLCGRLLAEPSPIAEAMWEQVVRLRSLVQEWQACARRHADARELLAVLSNRHVQPGPITFKGEECWLFEQPAGNGRWLAIASMQRARVALHQAQLTAVKPQFYDIELQLPGRNPPSVIGSRPVLARRSEALSGMPVEMVAYLSDPAAFDARRVKRAQWTIGLIVVALAAVIAGFFAAWRAFRRQQQLSEMKTNFVSSVSHELRAPIASVQLMAEELVDGARPSDEKLAKYHRFIRQECRRLSGVIENVLDFARREQGRERFDFEQCDLRQLVSEAAELLRPYAAERGVRIVTACQGTPRQIPADPHALKRVLVNLVDNAIKHSPPDHEVVVGLEFDTEHVMLWVEDEGPGIPRAEQDRIFEKFYRIGSELRRQTQGVGLGLSIVKHLVEVHGGNVSVHSQVGEGSRFVVALPIPAEPISEKRALRSP